MFGVRAVWTKMDRELRDTFAKPSKGPASDGLNTWQRSLKNGRVWNVKVMWTEVDPMVWSLISDS